MTNPNPTPRPDPSNPSTNPQPPRIGDPVPGQPEPTAPRNQSGGQERSQREGNPPRDNDQFEKEEKRAPTVEEGENSSEGC